MASRVSDASASGAGAQRDAAAPGGIAERSPACEGQMHDDRASEEECSGSEGPITDKLSNTVENLRREKNQMMAQRKELTKKLMNARRKKQRLKRSLRVDVLSLRSVREVHCVVG